MSQSADIADAIVEVDRAIERFENLIRDVGSESLLRSGAYQDLRDAISGLQHESLGDGVHFDSLEEARAFAAR